jgi:hypothetical protein
MAGDVSVSVVGGQLVIEGDELGNQIAITSGTEPGSYVVHGLEGTNVILQPPADPTDPALAGESDGDSMSMVVVHGVRGARIAMGDGNDRVVLREARFHGDVGIRMGMGDDQVVVGPLRQTMPEPAPLATADGEAPPDEMPMLRPSVGVGGSLRIGTGEGSDRVHVASASIRGTLGVATDGGNDIVVLGKPATDAPVEPVATFDPLGPVDPMLRGAALRVAGGIHIELGEGDDGLTVNMVGAAGGLSADGGLGGDHLGVRASRVGRALLLFGGEGEGADHVVVNHVAAHVAGIRTGAGNDTVRIIDSLFHLLGVALDGGNDSLAVEGNKAYAAVLLGGEGEDTLLGLSHNRFRRQLVRGFELPPMDSVGGAI